MKVLRPFQKVADWCGGKLVKNGIKFDYIEIEHHGEVHRLYENDWIIAERDETGEIIGFIPVRGDRARHFEENHRRARLDECN